MKYPVFHIVLTLCLLFVGTTDASSRTLQRDTISNGTMLKISVFPNSENIKKRLSSSNGGSFSDADLSNPTTDGGNRGFSDSDMSNPGTDKGEVSHTHTLIAVQEITPTCEDEGRSAYWLCSGCGKLFADANGSVETALGDLAIPSTGHILETHDNGDGTHITQCSRCEYHLSAAHTFTDGVCSLCGATEPSHETDISELDNVLYIKNQDVYAGSKAIIPVYMKNANSLTAFSFEITLPDDITIAKDASGRNLITLDAERKSATHSISSNITADKTIHVACLSLQSEAFSGNDGAVVNIAVDIDEDIPHGTYPIKLKNIVMSTPNTEKFTVPLVQSSITVADYLPGDVDNDGEITIVDAVGIVNIVIKNGTSGLNEKAADADGDGEITIVDAVAVVNKVIHVGGQ